MRHQVSFNEDGTRRIPQKVRQILTIIAKILQNMANGTTNGSKDPRLLPLSEYIVNNQRKVFFFFFEIYLSPFIFI